MPLARHNSLPSRPYAITSPIRVVTISVRCGCTHTNGVIQDEFICAPAARGVVQSSAPVFASSAVM